MSVGERIKKKRMEKGWSLQELADRMGYANKSTVARIENGEIDPPQSKIVKFAESLNVSVAYLMGWEEKNDAIADIIVRMRTDEKFFAAAELLERLEPEQLEMVVQFLKTFVK